MATNGILNNIDADVRAKNMKVISNVTGWDTLKTEAVVSALLTMFESYDEKSDKESDDQDDQNETSQESQDSSASPQQTNNAANNGLSSAYSLK